MRYRAEIDGLRALAVVPVILFHAGFELFSGGFVGVDVFFVISGYLITTIIISDLDRGTFSLANFYERRARRILPALFFVMFMSFVLAWIWLLPSAMKSFTQSLVAVTTFSSNILFWLQTGYFDGSAELKPLLHTWSLAVEEQYYIIFPLFLLATWRLGKSWVLTLIVGILLISLGTAQSGAYRWPSANFYLLTSRGWELLIGVLVAFYIKYKDTPLVTPSTETGGALGIALIAVAIFGFDSHTPFPSAYALIPTLGTAMIILFAVDGTLANRVLASKAFVGIGLISYSAYLWHQPLLAFAKYRSPTEPSQYLLLFLCLLSFPLAYLSWRHVEMPFRAKKKIAVKPFFAGSLIVAVTFIMIGLIGHKTSGFERALIEMRDDSLASIYEQFSISHKYVGKRWDNEIVLRDFDHDPVTRNILVIGDSYAKDLTNAIYESGLAKSYFLSGYSISRRCGNVWTDEDLSAHISADDMNACKKNKRFGHPQLLKLMQSADEIWLVSSWRQWQVPYLPETIKRIHETSDAKLRIFGRKNFGRHVSFYNYIDVTDRGLLPYTVDLSKEHVKTNLHMRASIDEHIFVDISALLCGQSSTCVNSTSDGFILSFDGGHLTKKGALYMGEQLKSILMPRDEESNLFDD